MSEKLYTTLDVHEALDTLICRLAMVSPYTDNIKLEIIVDKLRGIMVGIENGLPTPEGE